MKHLIRQYSLEPGALEIQYIEESFLEFQKRKTVDEIVTRLKDREHLILLSMAALPEDPDTLIPVAFKVGHELKARETNPVLADLVNQLRDCVGFSGRRVFYSWIGGTREGWRGIGHYRALTEQQEEWALEKGFNEIVVKTKNRFYSMRATLDHLQFDVVKFQPNPTDNGESKVFLSKIIGPDITQRHQTERFVTHA